MRDVGWAGLGIVPTFDGFGQRLEAGMARPMVAAGKEGGERFGDSASAAAGERFSSKLGGILKTGLKVTAAGAGVAVGAAFVEGMNREAETDRVAAALGLSGREQERLGRIAGNLYAKAFGDSYGEVAAAVTATQTSLKGLSSGADVRRATKDALNFSKVFDVDLPRAVQVAGTVINNGLAKDSTRAFDLLTRASQKVPAQLQEDVLDAAEEYGGFFKTLGYSGKESFDLLAKGAEGGVYGIDKAGDAIKEFTIRSTDMSKSSVSAYGLIGLNAQEMADKILAGGEDARSATRQIIDGLLSIESPSARANAAIALFGTPIEDLNVSKIPAFLRSLEGTSGKLDKVKGSAKRMGDTLNDNLSTDVTEMKRQLETKLVTFMTDEGLPALERFSDWFKETGKPALKDFADEVKPTIGVVKDLVGWLSDLPSEAKIASLTALLGGVGAVKLRGGRGGALGTVGSALGLSKPVPVFVTNKGFGAGGGDSIPDKVAKGGWVAAAGLSASIAAGMGLGMKETGDWLGKKLGEDVRNSLTAGWSAGSGSGSGMSAPSGWLQQDLADDANRNLEKVKPTLDTLNAKLATYGDSLDLAGRTKVDPDFALDGVKAAQRELQRYIAKQVEARQPVRTDVVLTGIERALRQIETLNAGLNSDATRGMDNGVTYAHGGGGGGLVISGPVTVKANTTRELQHGLTTIKRRSAMGGWGG